MRSDVSLSTTSDRLRPNGECPVKSAVAVHPSLRSRGGMLVDCCLWPSYGLATDTKIVFFFVACA